MDEIEASPPKEFQYRLHRLNHKKKSLKCLDEILSQKRRREILQPLYEENHVVGPADCSWNIFDEQLLLANAERQVTGTTRRNITPSKGFQNSINLQGIVDDDEDLVITESELLNICDAAEKSLASPQHESSLQCPSTPPAANTSRSIVELILDDFCSSLPSSPELQRTPPVVFKRKNCLRTYKRKKNRDEQILRDIEFEQQNVTASNNDTASDNGEPVDFVESQRICKNLCNLSDFFHSEDPKNCTLNAPDAEGILPSTQSSGDVYLTALETNKESPKLVDILSLLAQDIICYRQKYPWRKRKSTSEEFYGFSNGEDDDVNEPLKANNADICIDDRNDFRDSDGSSHSWFEEDSELFVNIDTSVLDAKTNLFSPTTPIPKFVGFQTASRKKIALSKEAQEKAAQILEALPELTERTKKTKNPYPTDIPTLVRNSEVEPTTTTTPRCMGFQTASNKGIKLSKEAQERAARILESLPELKEHSKKTKEAYPTDVPPLLADRNKEAPSTATPKLGGFQTASNKEIRLSKEAQARAAQILESLPDLKEHSKKTKEAYPTTNSEKTDTSEKKCDVVEEDFENMQLSEWLSGHPEAKPVFKKEQSNSHTSDEVKPLVILDNVIAETLPHRTDESKRKASDLFQNVPDLPIECKPSGSVNTPKRQCMNPKPLEFSQSTWPFELNDENCQAISCSTPINPALGNRTSHIPKCSPLSAALTQPKTSRRNLLSLNKRKRKPGLSVTVDDSTNTGGYDNNQNVCAKTQALLDVSAQGNATQPMPNCDGLLGASEPLTPLPLKNNCRISGLRRRGRRLLAEAKGD